METNNAQTKLHQQSLEHGVPGPLKQCINSVHGFQVSTKIQAKTLFGAENDISQHRRELGGKMECYRGNIPRKELDVWDQRHPQLTSG